MLYLKGMTEIVKIESMSYGENAISHLQSGKTVFVRGAKPGDICEIEFVSDKKKFCIAKNLSSKPETPGAPWAHIPYSDQLIYKRKNVVDAFSRTGGLDAENAKALVAECRHTENIWNYRNKIEFRYINNKLCMFDDTTEKYISIDQLSIANKSIEKAPKAISGALNYINKNNALNISRVGIRASSNFKSIEVALYTPPGKFPRHEIARVLEDATKATSIVRVLCDKNNTRKVKGVEVLAGDGFWKEKINDYKYFVSAPSFFQVNSLGAEILQTEVMQLAGHTGASNVADLYCGCGTFTIPLACSGFRVVGVELEGSSTRDLKRNLEINKTHAQVICDDVGRTLNELGKPDLVVVDPPKKGIEKITLSKIINLNVPNIIYVSCDPITLARDVKQLIASGYKLTSVTPVDMFPQTFHVECVVLLTKVHKKKCKKGLK